MHETAALQGFLQGYTLTGNLFRFLIGSDLVAHYGINRAHWSLPIIRSLYWYCDYHGKCEFLSSTASH